MNGKGTHGVPRKFYLAGSYIAYLCDVVHVEFASSVLENYVVFGVKKHRVGG